DRTGHMWGWRGQPGRGSVVLGAHLAAVPDGGAYDGPVFFFSSSRRHTRSYGDWSSDVCSSDLSWSHFHPRLRAAGRNRAWRHGRSEERRVGKESRSPLAPDQEKKDNRTAQVAATLKRRIRNDSLMRVFRPVDADSSRTGDVACT